MIDQIKKTEGLIAAPFTPMDESGNLELSCIPKYADWLVENGVVGVFICGTTGEGLSLTTEERILAAEAWSQAKGNLRLIVHVGHNSLNDARTLAEHAGSIKADAIGCMPPHFYKPGTIEQVANCCAEVAKAAPDIPFYYYHIPSMSGVDIQVAELLPVLENQLSSFAGIKFTYEDLDDYKACLDYKGGRYDILFGRDENLLQAIRLGALGAVGSTYNFAAPLYLNLINKFKLGDMQTAEKFQSTAIDLINKCASGSWHPIAAFKQLMQLVGVACGPTRLPIPPITRQEAIELEKQTRAVLESDPVRQILT